MKYTKLIKHTQHSQQKDEKSLNSTGFSLLHGNVSKQLTNVTPTTPLKFARSPLEGRGTNSILGLIISLPEKQLNLLKCIFFGKKRHSKLFYSLTTIGNALGWERSWTGRNAQALREAGLLKIHGRYWDTHVWDLGDIILKPAVYSFLHQFFMGFGVRELLSNIPVYRKSPLSNIIKIISRKREDKAVHFSHQIGEQDEGRSPESAPPNRRKLNFRDYCDKWDATRWVHCAQPIGEPNTPLTQLEAQEIFG